MNQLTARLTDERIDRQNIGRLTDSQIHALFLSKTMRKISISQLRKKILAQIRFLGQTNDPTLCFFLSRGKLHSSALKLASCFFIFCSGAKTRKIKERLSEFRYAKTQIDGKPEEYGFKADVRLRRSQLDPCYQWRNVSSLA